MRLLVISLEIAFLLIRANASLKSDDILVDNSQSAFSRSVAASLSQITNPSEPKVKRSHFPRGNDPHICLAFLSCCDRTDLLNHTIAAAIRHMEADEPSFLRYEIAWVDNGSRADMTQKIADAFQIEHALRLPQNMGLAYGMNLLIFNLCKAPYILLLEEDWLYLDELVAPQTPERLRVIATSLALLESIKQNNITAFDRRRVMGVFLRHESYESFLKFPLMDNWETIESVEIGQQLDSMYNDHKQTCEMPSNATTKTMASSSSTDFNVDIDYRIFCGDVSFQTEAVWGSYTNGAGLYRRSDLMSIGRMYGEPGDAFHDRYVESNYAYRAAIQFCHGAVRLTDDRSCEAIFDPKCTGAFHHIGGGRGTRPMNTKGTTCDDRAWNFFGTPLYQKYHRFMEKHSGQSVEICTKEQLEGLRQRNFRDRGTSWIN